MRRFPLIAAHDAVLQRCVYCPKLCRAACPVANVEGSETLTPWGKMSLAYFAARGDVPMDREHAIVAWACTGCEACSQRCEHGNDVAGVLLDVRAEAFSAGAAPEQARAVAERWPSHQRELKQALGDATAGTDDDASTALVVGCAYALRAPQTARDVIEVARRFAGPVRVVASCCGLPLLAGDRPGLLAAARAFRADLGAVRRLVVADPGCARLLLDWYPRLGVSLPEVSLLVDLVASRMHLLGQEGMAGQQLRYLDPCHLGRGLTRYDGPRAVLARLTGRDSSALIRTREQSECSGGGGLLPVIWPETSCAIAGQRIAEHRASAEGALVTCCGSGLHRYRSLGQEAVDLMTLVARAIR